MGSEPGNLSGNAVTRLVAAPNPLDGQRLDELYRLVEKELRAIAEAKMASERAGHTLQPTVLVNDAFMKLASEYQGSFENRRHFFGAASEAMRRILIDHARARNAVKRGGGRPMQLSDDPGNAVEHDENVIGVDEELEALAEAFPRAAEVVKLRFFGGLTSERIAEVLGISERTVRNDWNLGRAWLHDRLRSDGGSTAESD